MSFLKGKRTVILAFLTIFYANVQGNEGILTNHQASIVLNVIGLAMLALRAVTDTPIGKSTTKEPDPPQVP